MDVSGINNDAVVVIGAGTVGATIARRQGPGKTIVLADRDEATLHALAGALADEGHEVVARVVDISVRDSVCDLARVAAAAGRISQVAIAVHVSPTHAPPAEILAVNLQGVGVALEVLSTVVSRGTSGVVVSSMAGYLAEPLTAEQEQTLAAVWADELLLLDFTDPAEFSDSASAYALAHQCVRTLVQAAAVRWGWRGARVNSISRGAIGRMPARRDPDDISSALPGTAGLARSATPDDIAAAAAFLLGSESSFVTGIDVFVDGGVVAALRTDQLTLLDV
ncbi:SDR family oxidoreductase [Mycobacterium sp. 48b]|uniref:SDR family oxidoreductase n=1 Tax=Mycobacterium sp. 48b TaxID=3400426 RepID=UPI003AAB5E74